MSDERITRAGLLGAALGALAGALSGREAAQAATPTSSWRHGTDAAYVGGGVDGGDPTTLTIQAAGDLNVGARHIRMGTADGNYEFEHGQNVPETHLNSYYVGTPRRTPISIGGDDGQDVLSLIVRGKQGQKHDLQQWAPGGKPTAAVDGKGRLRLGRVVLLAEISNGKARLVAVLPDGTRQVLAVGR